MAEWNDLGAWWVEELAGDPSYHEVVLEVLAEVVPESKGHMVLDVGCGEGRVLRWLISQREAHSIGVDIEPSLLRLARSVAPCIRGRLPDLGFLRDSSLDGAVVVLVLEHISDTKRFISELGRAIRPGGFLSLIVNHPIVTAKGSAQVIDPTDGEVFWRWGQYLDQSFTDEPAGTGTVRFHHRSTGELMTTAARTFDLQVLVERSTGDGDPLRGADPHIPGLLGVRWSRRISTLNDPADPSL